MRLVKQIVAVDDALDGYRDALTELLVEIDQNIRHQNTEADEVRAVWREMRVDVVKIRDAAYDGFFDDIVASLVRRAAAIAR